MLSACALALAGSLQSRIAGPDRARNRLPSPVWGLIYSHRAGAWFCRVVDRADTVGSSDTVQVPIRVPMRLSSCHRDLVNCWAMGTLAKRTRLFNLGVSALEKSILVRAPDGETIRDAYACPLCIRFFSRDAIVEHLTIEHVPADSVGGMPLVLTCAWCNNGAGTSIDEELSKHNRMQQALRGERPMRVSVDGVNALMQLRPAEVHLAVDTKHTEPKRAREWMAQANAGEAPFEIVGDIRDVPIERSVQLSMLRSAYLAAFALEGYRHILGTAYLPFRRQMRDLDVDVIEAMPVLHKPEWPSGIREARHPAVGRTLMFGWREWRILLPFHPDDAEWLGRFESEHHSNTAMVAAHQVGRHLPVRPLHRLDFESKLEGDLQPVELF